MEYFKYDPLKNEFIKSPAPNNSVLPQVVWHITDKCLLSCPYCFSAKTNKDTPYEKAEAYMKLFRILGVQKIDIAGGEPLIYDYLDVVCNDLKASGINFTITTSGVGKDSNKKWLVEHCDIFSRIIFSLDGATEEQHDFLRGKKGTYSKLIGLFNQLKKKQYGKLRINTVITGIFSEDSNCEKIAGIIAKLQPLEWCIVQPHPANQKINYSKYSISDKQFAEIIEKINSITANIKGFNTKIIYRYTNNYSTYWVLYPEGILSQHTTGAEDRNKYSFDENTIDTISKTVLQSDLWVP